MAGAGGDVREVMPVAGEGCNGEVLNGTRPDGDHWVAGGDGAHRRRGYGSSSRPRTCCSLRKRRRWLHHLPHSSKQGGRTSFRSTAIISNNERHTTKGGHYLKNFVATPRRLSKTHSPNEVTEGNGGKLVLYVDVYSPNEDREGNGGKF